MFHSLCMIQVTGAGAENGRLGRRVHLKGLLSLVYTLFCGVCLHRQGRPYVNVSTSVCFCGCFVFFVGVCVCVCVRAFWRLYPMTKWSHPSPHSSREALLSPLYSSPSFHPSKELCASTYVKSCFPVGSNTLLHLFLCPLSLSPSACTP